MQAWVCRRYGSADKLQLEHVPQPRPGAGQVLVKVRAASINAWDWDILRGRPMNRMGNPFVPMFRVLGADIAGEVAAVGPGDTPFKEGDAVFGDLTAHGWGAFAEYVCVPAAALARKSERMSFEQAAAIPQAGMMALQAIRDKADLQAGQQVLINGAGGGVGTFAIQMAKQRGVHITGVERAEKFDMLRALGVDELIDYRQQNYTRLGRQYDLIVDVVADRPPRAYRRALKPQGLFVMVGGTLLRIMQVGVGSLLRSQANGPRLELLIWNSNTADLDAMTELFERGEVVPVIDRVYPFSETREAMRYFSTGLVKGKVVVSMGE